MIYRFLFYSVILFFHIAPAQTSVEAESEFGPHLKLELDNEGLEFSLTNPGGSSAWVLQQSHDTRIWMDLVFLEPAGEARALPGVNLPWGALSNPDANHSFFRVVQLENVDPFHRQSLVERTKWRIAGIKDYSYELRQNFGFLSWHGNVVVRESDVASFKTIEHQPPFLDVPAIPAIDDLFDRIANAIAANANTIDIEWNPEFGFPASCFIDIDLQIADEESGWTILDFSPAP